MPRSTSTRLMISTGLGVVLLASSAFAQRADFDRNGGGPRGGEQPQQQAAPQIQAPQNAPRSSIGTINRSDARPDRGQQHSNPTLNNQPPVIYRSGDRAPNNNILSTRDDNDRRAHGNGNWNGNGHGNGNSNGNNHGNGNGHYNNHNDHGHSSGGGVTIINNNPYYGNNPRYIPAPRYYGYGRDRHMHRYYYSNYYTTRYIYVEPTNPYVEVRCTGTPIVGTVVGGVAGGLVGNQFGHGKNRTVATIGGALLGAIIGQSIDRQDESCAYQALEYAQPNTQVAWANPDDNYAYTVTPGAVTQQGNGRYCREYQAQVLVGDQLQSGYGTACRQPDGSWQVMN